VKHNDLGTKVTVVEAENNEKAIEQISSKVGIFPAAAKRAILQEKCDLKSPGPVAFP